MSLSSFVVQNEIATMRQVEEALARQVLYGGDFITNLLEVAAIDERKLTRAAAEAYGLLPAPAGELPAPERRARTMIPAELASHRSLYPLALSFDGDELVLAVSEPLASEEEEQLNFALGVPIVQRIAPLVRIRQALHREFGAPLERRLERLLMRLHGDSRAISSDLPPLLRDAPSPEEPPAPPLRTGEHAVIPDVALPPAPPVPVFTIPIEPRLPDEWGEEPDEPYLRQSVPPSDIQSRMEVAPPPMRTTPVGAGPVSPAPPEPSPSRLATLIRESSVMPRPVRRRRGPLTLEAASAELENVADRDHLMDLFFDFARQYFDYSAMFIVHTDLAEGRESFGPGASRDRVAGIGVPLDLPSILASARDIRAPIVAKPDLNGLDGVLLKDLERPTQHTIMCVPLVVRSRVVAALYGDAGDLDIDRDAVADVSTFALLAGQTLERMILKKKLGGFSGAGGAGGGAGRITDPNLVLSKRGLKTPSAQERALRAEALGRALFSGAATIRASTSTPPPSAPRPAGARQDEYEDEVAQSAPLEEPEQVEETQETEAAQETEAVQAAAPEPEPERISYSESGWDDVVLTPVAAVAEEAPAPVEEPPEPVAAVASVTAVASAASAARVVSPDEEEIFSDAADVESVHVSDAEDEQRAREAALMDIVVPPRTPPVPHADAEALPSVIVDVSRELELLVERYIQTGDDDYAEGELLREGHQAMPVLMARFPGPIVREPSANERELPMASTCGPVLRLIAMQRRVALPWVLEHVDSRNEEKRYWATFLLRELAYVDAIPRLVTRLLDVSDRVRRAARWATAGMARQHGEETARELGRVVRDPTVDSKKRLTMLEVLEEIREPLAVPTFIAVLNDDSEDIAVAARRALLVVARQDFARDTRRWTQWWNANSSRDRIEWLIDALVHDSQVIRRAAGEELKAITKEYFGYYDDLPKRDRDRAQARYHEWWITEGRARFMRPT
ncbi:hypothetical protein LZC95_35645 [Pendulispora brunnea]|uniref:Type II secretion system protein GspE N-terminal domain-containing protein n=1 Tax=Pendulispora brunnea TaxID=2905690 RepID=A0ABZ2JZ56_9BACT